MKGLLQKFDFRSSRYERPTQKWTCGRAAAGMTCGIGPDARGRCRATFECEPKQSGDRWSCTRAPGRGGACGQGPLPDGTCCRAIAKCVPVRSLRANRGRAVALAVGLTLGLLVIAIQGSGITALLSPGPVTLHHGEIEDCGSCHEGISDGPVAWIHAAFAPGESMANSKKCLACHVLGENALKPHSLPPQDLLEIGEANAARGILPAPATLKAAIAVFGSPSEDKGDLACANCHREHEGQGFVQTTVSDGRCQSCHKVKFEALSAGHPSFAEYPFTRRPRINFDHVSHFARHFEKAGPDKAPKTCTACHSPAADGRKMLVENFAKTCSACHLEQIEGVGQVGPKGIAVVAVPGLDLFELRERAAAIGEWPEWSEEKVSPFLEAFLSGGNAGAPDFDRLRGLDLLDLTEATDRDIEEVERLVWGVKGLIHDLIVEGPVTVELPLSGAFGENLDRVAFARLIEKLPLDVVQAAQQTWFPSLFKEVSMHRRGIAVPIPSEGEDSDTASGTTDDAPPPDAPGDEEDILSEEEGDILEGDEDDILSAEEGDILEGDEDDILSEEEGGILEGDEDDILSAEEGDILEGGEDDILSDDDGDILEGDEDEILSAEDGEEDVTAGEDVQPSDDLSVTMPQVDAEHWAERGGWYRRDFALYYRPAGHADRFMRTWLDLGGLTYGTAAEPVGRAIFAHLSSPEAPGRCAKCHSVDREEDDSLNVKWHPLRSNPLERTATYFSHSAHFSMLGEEGCLTCHKLNPAMNFAASYREFEPHSFVSNFKPIEVEICATCHVEERAGEACQTCHQYHLGTFPLRAVHTEMSVKKE